MTPTPMTTNQPIDFFDIQALAKARETDHPRITITLPTERSGSTDAGSIRLRNLLDAAHKKLSADGVAEGTIDNWLAPARELVSDSEYWRFQADGLVVLIEGESTLAIRVPHQLPDQVSVGQEWRLRPLVHLLSEDSTFHLLALSRNKMRLFQTDGVRIAELDLGTIPASQEELYDDFDHQRFRQDVPQGGGDASFHGHSKDGDIERIYTERFLREVAKGLDERFPAAQQYPLILAGVEHLTNTFREFVKWNKEVLKHTVAGSTDTLSETQLMDRLKAPLEEWHKTHDEQILKAIEDARSGKRFVTGLDEIAQAAEQGQIDTLLVQPDTSGHGLVELDELDHLMGQTLRAQGKVQEISDKLEFEHAAITRW